MEFRLKVFSGTPACHPGSIPSCRYLIIATAEPNNLYPRVSLFSSKSILNHRFSCWAEQVAERGGPFGKFRGRSLSSSTDSLEIVTLGLDGGSKEIYV